MSILIKNAFHQDKQTDIFIKGNRIAKIGSNLQIQADQIIDGTGKAILPSFVNGHTHASMTLLRGYADDMELYTWLNQYIWPLEAKLTEENVYVGAKLACLEMIKSGITLFNDMYWYYHSTARAVEEMGIRAALSSVFIDFQDQQTAKQRWEECLQLYQENKIYSQRIIFALGPHAIYSVSPESLIRVRDFARHHNLIIHMHLCETEKEVQDCLRLKGQTPVEFLDSLDLLGPNLCACHCIWLKDRDIDLIKEKGVKIVHNPTSNLKLCSGYFPYGRLRAKGIDICLGTDGCSSNNNLDMLEEMKFAALAAKASHGDPTIMPANEAFKAATYNGGKTFGLDIGEIKEGNLADCILVELNHPQLTPNYNLISNLVYSANSECIHSTICDGKVLMQDRQVPGENEILDQARKTSKKLIGENNQLQKDK